MLLGCSHHHTPVAEIVLRIPRTALMEPCVARDLVEDRLPVLAPLHALISVQQTIPHATAMAPPCAHPTPKAARARSHRLTGPRARENARVSFAEPQLWNRKGGDAGRRVVEAYKRLLRRNASGRLP